jgi:PhnB protein
MKGSAVMLQFADRAERAEMFQRLSENGRVTVPLARQYWGTDFGMLVDAFGVHWMFNEGS